MKGFQTHSKINNQTPRQRKTHFYSLQVYFWKVRLIKVCFAFSKICLFKLLISMDFKFIQLCSHHRSQDIITDITPKVPFCPFVVSPLPYPPPPGNHSSDWCLYWLAFPRMLYKWNHKVSDLLYLATFTWHSALQIHLCSCLIAGSFLLLLEESGMCHSLWHKHF